MPRSLSKTTLSPMVMRPRRRRFQTRDHAQRRGLAAAGRAEQRDERIVLNDKIQVFHGVELGPSAW